MIRGWDRTVILVVVIAVGARAIATVGYLRHREKGSIGLRTVAAPSYAAELQEMDGAAWPAFLSDDSRSYIMPAFGLKERLTFTRDYQQARTAETLRTPGYPLLLAAAISVGIRTTLGIVVLQIGICALTVLLTYRLARVLSNSKLASIIAAALVALDPVSIFYAHHVLTETTFTVLLTAGVYLYSLYLRRLNPWLGVASAGTFTMGTFVRPILYFLLPLLAIGVVASNLYEATSRRRAFVGAAGMLWVFVVFVGGWQLRNKALTGEAVFSSIQGTNMLRCRAAGVLAQREGISLDKAQERLETELAPPGFSLQEHLSSQEMTRLGVRVVLDDPLSYLAVAAKGLLRTMFGPCLRAVVEWSGVEDAEGSGAMQRIAHGLQNHPVAFAVTGVWSVGFLIVLWGGIACLLFRGGGSVILGKDRWHVLLVVGYLLLVSAGPEAYSRFRVPLVPLLSVYAAAGWVALLWPRREAFQAKDSIEETPSENRSAG